MKKLLVAVLACAMVAPAFAAFDNVQITGDIQTIGLAVESQGAGNVTVPAAPSPNNDLRVTQSRVLLGVGVDLVEDVQAKLTFAHEWIWGTDTINGTDINTLETNTLVQEAFVNISNVFDALEVKVGRQFYGDVNSAVMYFGPTYGYVNYNTPAGVPTISRTTSSLDGATAQYNGDNLTLTAAYLTLTNDVTGLGPTYAANSVSHIAGLDGIFKANDNLALQAYVYDVRTRGADTFGFWGVKPTFDIEALKIAAEFAMNYGAVEKGYLVKADVALPLEMEKANFTPRATYLQIGKGFSAYGNYRPGLMFGTLLANAIDTTVPSTTTGYDVTNLGVDRLEVINVGLCMKFAGAERWGFGLDFYRAKLEGQFIGNSWEAKVIYNHNEYVSFNLTGALLNGVGQKLSEAPVAGQLGMNIKF